ncbi:MAG: hypothetical protein KKH67_14620, partial [candidate division Zixibacteria bacterium]|nr:hypothetical protein [candidate division Zixibacteria bacterium]
MTVPALGKDVIPTKGHVEKVTDRGTSSSRGVKRRGDLYVASKCTQELCSCEYRMEERRGTASACTLKAHRDCHASLAMTSFRVFQ